MRLDNTTNEMVYIIISSEYINYQICVRICCCISIETYFIFFETQKNKLKNGRAMI